MVVGLLKGLPHRQSVAFECLQFQGWSAHTSLLQQSVRHALAFVIRGIAFELHTDPCQVPEEDQSAHTSAPDGRKNVPWRATYQLSS